MVRSYLSYSATVILQTIANGYEYGFDITDVTGLPSGTVYPALRRLEDLGYVDSRWEKHEIAQRELRPANRFRAWHRLRASGAARRAIPLLDA